MILFALCAALLPEAPAQRAAARRAIRLSDVPAAAHAGLPASDAAFGELLRSINRRTEERLREGEYDHLVA